MPNDALVAFGFLGPDRIFLFIRTMHSFNFIIKHYRSYIKSEFV
jgi:hypothetical protein